MPAASSQQPAASHRFPLPEPFQRVARLDDLPDGTLMAVVTSDGTRICLLNIDGEVHAVSDTCTHQEFSLAEGVLLPDGCLECAWHGAVFDPRTGAVKRWPATEPLPVYEVQVRDGDIYVGARKS